MPEHAHRAADDVLPTVPPSLFSLLSPALGNDFFESLVAHLTTIEQADHALVGMVVGPQRDRIATLAVSHRGKPLPNYEYALRGTPCAEVVGLDVCFIDTGLRQRFPEDRILVDLGIESYLGCPLVARDGEPLGILAALHGKPLPQPRQLETILRLVAGRTAVEIERQRAVEALRSSEARLAAVVDGSPGVAVQWYDRDGRVRRWNHGSELMYGFSSAEAIGKRLDQLIHTPAEMAAFHDTLATIERTRQAVGPLEYVFRRRDGRRGTCWATLFPIPGEDGATWFVCMDVDITAQKVAEAERQQIEEQMRQAQKLESLGMLAGGVAHDFNNLLTSVLGNTSLLEAHLPPGSASAEMLMELKVAARRAADLTRQMLAYAGKAAVVVAPFDLADLVREMLQLLAVPARRVELHTDLQPAVVSGDATQVRQVVMNLITNACEALEGRAGSVLVRTGRRQLAAHEQRAQLGQKVLPAGEYAFFEVVDAGCGMDPATVARIFDPFFTTKQQGRGLGLAAVQGIVRGHGGTIVVTSVPGQGTTMTVVLPLSSTRLPEHRVDAPSTSQGHGRVLVVDDDDDDVRRVAARMLAAAGYEPVEAIGGFEAIAMVRAAPTSFEAVFIDLTMPRCDGFEVARQLQALAPQLPRILMSGYSDPSASTNEVGLATAFVPKPFTKADLAQALAQVRGSVPAPPREGHRSEPPRVAPVDATGHHPSLLS